MSAFDGPIKLNRETIGLFVIATGVAFGFMVLLAIPEGIEYYYFVRYGLLAVVAVWTTYIYQFIMNPKEDDDGNGGGGSDGGTRRKEGGGDGLLGRFQN